jgi:hypothetical protein
MGEWLRYRRSTLDLALALRHFVSLRCARRQTWTSFCPLGDLLVCILPSEHDLLTSFRVAHFVPDCFTPRCLGNGALFRSANS